LLPLMADICSALTSLVSHESRRNNYTYVNGTDCQSGARQLSQFNIGLVFTWRPCIARPAHSFDKKLTNAQYLSGNTRTL